MMEGATQPKLLRSAILRAGRTEGALGYVNRRVAGAAA